MKMIRSMLDTDLYKLTMQWAILKNYPNADVQYKFILRNKRVFQIDFIDKLRNRINQFADIKLADDEYHYLLQTCPYLPRAYIDFLRGYRYDPSEVLMVTGFERIPEMAIRGPWYRTVLWETPLMATISELFFEDSDVDVNDHDHRITDKTRRIISNDLTVADFGTRRRFSYSYHNSIIKHMKHVLAGTSNVHMAMKHDLKPIGTHAHEWFMFHGAKYGYQSANYQALKKWQLTFEGDLGIALTDTYTTDIFLQSFNMKYAKLFDGVRHDSGDPYEFTDKIINHYRQFGIDPMSKTIVFSDGLNIQKAVEIAKYCNDKIKCSFGIGTHLTNDIDGITPLNMVIKLWNVNGRPTIKLSDDSGKHTGSQKDVDSCKYILGINTETFPFGI